MDTVYSGDRLTEDKWRNRWRGLDGEKLADEVFACLLDGKRLDDLGLGEHEGRIDLRGIQAPIPARLRRFQFEKWVFEELGGLLNFRSVHFENMDFSGAFLDNLRFFQMRIDNCRFDQAMCQSMKMWATDVINTSFDSADLRNFVTGSWYEGRGTIFDHVSFRNANMKSIVSPSATYIDCDFSNAKIVKVDFQSSSFIRCRFAGELKQVIFWDHGFKTGKPDANPMEDVDFSEAQFNEVEFRRLNLDRVKMPTSEGHIILSNYRCVLERALTILKDDSNPNAYRLRASLEFALKWAGPNQQMGIFERRDFQGMENYAIDLLRHCERECSRSEREEECL